MPRKRPAAKVSPAKARKILRHGEVRGKPLSPAQKRLFGYKAGKKGK